MSVVTPDMKALGIGPDLEIGGKRLELALLDMTDWMKFSKWCRTRAWDRLEEQAAGRPAEWYARQSDILQDRMPSYDYMQSGFVRELQTLAGLTQATWISLNKKHRGEVTEQQVAEAVEARFGEILTALAAANADDDDTPADGDEPTGGDARPKGPRSSGTPPGG